MRVRPKRTGGDRIETTVTQLLEHSLADSLGFVDEDGRRFRQCFYDIEIYTSPAP